MQESGLAQKVERTLSELETIGVEPTLSRKIYVKIVKAGFNRATLASAFVLMQLAAQFQPDQRARIDVPRHRSAVSRQFRQIL